VGKGGRNSGLDANLSGWDRKEGSKVSGIIPFRIEKERHHNHPKRIQPGELKKKYRQQDLEIYK